MATEKQGIRKFNTGGFIDDYGNFRQPAGLSPELPPNSQPTFNRQFAAAESALEDANAARRGIPPAASSQGAAYQTGRALGRGYAALGGASGIASKAVNIGVPLVAGYNATMGDDAITVKGWREGEPGAEEKGQWGRNRAGLEEAALRVGDWGTKGVGYLADWALPKGQPGFNQAYRENLAGAGLDGVSIPVKERGLPAVATPENIARAQAVGDYTRDKYFSPTPGGDDIKGAAARIQAANPRGVQAVPQMARTLAQESQQRFAPQQAYQQPWGDAPMGSTQHGLYQLGVMRQLNDTPQYGPGIIGNAQEANYAQPFLDAMRGVSGKGRIQDRQRQMYADLARSVMNNNSADRVASGHDQAAFGLEGLRGQNQMRGYEMQGQTARDVAGIQGQNQMRGYEMQGQNQFALQEARLGAEAPYRNAQAGYFGAQTNKINDDMEQGKTEFGMITKLAIDIMKNEGVDYATAMGKASKTVLGAQRAAAQKQEGKAVGYAAGGAVDSPYTWGDAASGITRKTINGIDHITDPNAPGGANYQSGSSTSGGLGRAGGYGSFTNSAGKMFGDAPKGETYGGEISRAYGTNRDGDVTITPNQRAQSMNAFGAREYEAAAQQPGTDAYSAEALKGINYALGRQQNEYADGGAVQPMSAAEKLLAEMDAKYGKTAGNAPAPAPQPAPQPVPQPAQQPQGIADRFRGYFGSPDTRMKQNGLAFGGAVPAQDVPGGRAVAQAVAGRQVFGQSDGSGRDDALPAVIDGERPAALTSGEFVWPVHAVKYFGMAKLNKMLAEAERGMAPQDEPA